MKQIITIFRAEGPQANRLIALCRRTRRTQLARLREAWREDIRANSRLSAYVEYMDGWSLGDDFARIIGLSSIRRVLPSGELFALRVTNDVLAHLRAQRRRKHQFREQALFAKHVASLAEGSGACEPPVALAVFRDILGSGTDDDMKEGSNQPLNGTARKLAAR